MRLFTRKGNDWCERFPAISAAAAKLRGKSFTIDGEAVVIGPDGLSQFDEFAPTTRAPHPRLDVRQCRQTAMRRS